MRARRSAADRFLRKEEAPGSNPGESMILRREQPRERRESSSMPGFEPLEDAAPSAARRPPSFGFKSRRVHSFARCARSVVDSPTVPRAQRAEPRETSSASLPVFANASGFAQSRRVRQHISQIVYRYGCRKILRCPASPRSVINKTLGFEPSLNSSKWICVSPTQERTR